MSHVTLSLIVAGAVASAALGCSSFGAEEAAPDVAGDPQREEPAAPPPKAAAFGLHVAGAASPPFVVEAKPASIAFVVDPPSRAALTVKLAASPQGVVAEQVSVPPGATEGTIALTSTSTTPQGPTELTLVAEDAAGGSARASVPVVFRGAPGSLDETYATKGVLRTVFAPSTGDLLDARLLSDDRLIVLGPAADGATLLRIDVNGVVDPTFGTRGRVKAADQTLAPMGLDVQRSGALADRIAVFTFAFGTATSTMHRYDADGRVVTSFGGTGAVDAPGEPSSILARSDGETLLVTRGGVGGGTTSVTTRGPDGGQVASTDGGVPGTKGRLVPQPDGGALLFYVGNTTDALLVTRLLPSGSFDPAFGSKVLGGSGSFAAAPLPNGGAVFVVANGPTVSWGRVSSTGALDTSLGVGGFVDSFAGEPRAIAVAADGKVLVAGRSLSGRAQRITIARHTADGKLDTEFGAGGRVTTPIGDGSNDDELATLQIQKDGRIVAVGSRLDTSDGFVARYWP